MSKEEEVTHPAASSKAASILDFYLNSPTWMVLKQSRGRFTYKRPLCSNSLDSIVVISNNFWCIGFQKFLDHEKLLFN